MSKARDEQRFEFLLTINGHIICQRYFSVPDYYETTRDVKGMIDSVAGINTNGLGIIPQFLKDKSVDYLWNMYNPYKQQLEEEIRRDVPQKEDVIGFEVKMDRRLLAKTEFSGNYFPPKVRYDIDIKEIIPEIIEEIRYYLSDTN